MFAQAISPCRLSALLLAISLVLPGAYAQETSQTGSRLATEQEVALTLLTQAENALFNERDYAAALELLNRHLSANPQDDRAYRYKGFAHEKQGRLEDALNANEKALHLNDKSSANWYGVCRTLILLNRPIQARPACEKLRVIEPNNVSALVSLGHTYLLTGKRSKAQDYYRKSLPGIKTEEALKDGLLADFDFFIQNSWQLKASHEEKRWLEENWVRHWQPLSRLVQESQHLEKEGKFADALPLMQEALRKTEEVLGREHLRTGDSLNNLARLYQAMGEYDRALPLFLRALDIAEKTLGQNHPETGTSLNNLANLYESMGEYDRALPLHLRALDIVEKTQGPNHPVTGTSLNNLANLYHAMGEYDRALPLHLRALDIAEKTLGQNHPATGTLLNNLANLYQAMGEYDRALPLFLRALDIAEKTLGQNHPETGTRLNNLAWLYQAMGEYDRALPLHLRALDIAEKTQGQNHPATGTHLNNLALLYQAMGEYDRALPLTLRALDIAEKTLGQNHPMTGKSLNNLAWLYRAMGQSADALPLLVRAAQVADQAGSPELLWTVQGNLCIFHAPTTPALAIFHGKQAVNALQSVRERMGALDKSLQGSFLKENEETFQLLADLLIDQGRFVEAEQVLELLKARELKEMRYAPANSATIEYVGPEKPVAAEQQALSERGVAQTQAIDELERQRKFSGGTLPSADEARYQELLRLAEAWRADYRRYQEKLPRVFANATIAPTGTPALAETKLQQRVALDREGAVGLHYVVTDERLSIIVATPRASFKRLSTVPRKELARQIIRLRQALIDKADTRPAAQALWQMLIAPVLADLQEAGAKTLTLSLTDILRYLPFATLQNADGRYLIEDYALANWAAAADITPDARKAPWQVTGLGVSEPRSGFAALPAVKAELKTIVRTPENREGILPGEIALDEQFGRPQLEAALTGQNNVIHIASHFDFRPGDESRSILLLGRGEPISIGQLGKMDFSTIEQLTLSACNTAIGGGINEHGAEVEGLAAVVLQQQAKAVLASLWPVNDASTALLMRNFYTLRAQANPVSRAQALRQAQLALLHQTQNPTEQQERAAKVQRPQQSQSAPAWNHPYYWAPFVLSGNWL